MVAPADGEPAAVSALDEADLMRLVDAADRIDATIEFYTPQGIFVSRLDDDCVEHAEAIDIEVEQVDLAEIIGQIPVVRAHWIFREPAREAVEAVQLDGAEVGFASSPVLPEMLFGSVTRKGTSKGSAAKFVAGEFGFDLGDAIGIGDAPGDLALLETVGHPYVVENSTDELRARFPVLGHVDRDGVLELLRAL
jgi:hydroxymethylpyrimidine pyrophosphatase-like HAD family hydrolase